MAKLKIVQFFGDQPNNNGYDNGIWQSVLNIPYAEDYSQAQNYDLVIRTMWLEGIGKSEAIRKNWPHVLQIGLSDHPLSSQISRLDGPRAAAYVKELQFLDGVMALTEEERQWYQIAAPSKPVVKVGLPFPFEAYETRYGHFRDSKKFFIGLGVGASDNDRNFISNILVFQRLRIDYPELKGVFLSVPDNLIPYTAYLCDQFPNMYIQERVDMETYYDILSQCRFVINLADRNTPGRLQGEAAFFGVPVIGSDRFELQRELFPQWSVSPYALEAATSHAERLLAGEPTKVPLEYAFKQLNNYNYAKSKRKFNALLRTIKGD